MLRRLYEARYLCLLLITGIVHYVIFHYFPIYGIILAFKQFRADLDIIA
ncbi:MAG: hypothetical protein ACOX8S_03780 [Christensenellales bacterium]